MARNLDGHRAVELFVAGFPHAAEAADAEPLDQLEAAQLRQRRRHARRLALIHQAEVAAARRAGEIRERRIRIHVDRRVAARAANMQLAHTCIRMHMRARVGCIGSPLSHLLDDVHPPQPFAQFRHQIGMRATSASSETLSPDARRRHVLLQNGLNLRGSARSQRQYLLAIRRTCEAEQRVGEKARRGNWRERLILDHFRTMCSPAPACCLGWLGQRPSSV